MIGVICTLQSAASYQDNKQRDRPAHTKSNYKQHFSSIEKLADDDGEPNSDQSRHEANNGGAYTCDVARGRHGQGVKVTEQYSNII